MKQQDLTNCRYSLYSPSNVSFRQMSLGQKQKLPENQVNIQAYQKFLSLLSKQHIQLFQRMLFSFRGTNNPIDYKKEFNFQQRWQKNTKTHQQINFNLFVNSNKLSYFLNFMLMIQNFMIVWFLSVFRIYEIRQNQIVFIISIFLGLFDSGYKLFLYINHLKLKYQKVELKQVFLNIRFVNIFAGDLYCFGYLILCCSTQILGNVQRNQFIIFDLSTIAILSYRSSQIYNYLLVLILASKHKNEMTILDLIIKMLVILHIFAVIIYAVAILRPQKNWLTRLQLSDNLWQTHYLYSLYFICTTMFTVGYGDIIPTNKYQMIAIMCIQAIGMIFLGFIINEVGSALGNMRQKRAGLQKDIFNAYKIANYYQLNPQLSKKMRDYVINNQIAQDQIDIIQQNQFLLKLNEELRNQVKQTNQLKIIKTSLFFISHWSKKIQAQMAKKLNKIIYASNQNLHGKPETNKLYILARGKIQIYTERTFGTKIYCRKLLKTIQKLPNQQIFNNVYGYTSFFSGKPNRLQAVSKQSSVCYTLNFQDIKDAINQDINDFQYFHQLRQTFQLSKNPQIWETPKIINSRQNYNPVTQYVIKKYNKFYKNQSRKNWIRNDKRFKKIYQSYKFQDNLEDKKETQSEGEEKQKSLNNLNSEFQFCNSLSKRGDSIKNYTSFQDKSKLISEKNKKPVLVVNRSYRRRYMQKQDKNKNNLEINKNSLEINKNSSDINKNNLEIHTIFIHDFQFQKNYTKYFPKGNPKVILEKLYNNPQLNCNKIRQYNPNYEKSFGKTIKRDFTKLLS